MQTREGVFRGYGMWIDTLTDPKYGELKIALIAILKQIEKNKAVTNIPHVLVMRKFVIDIIKGKGMKVDERFPERQYPEFNAAMNKLLGVHKTIKNAKERIKNNHEDYVNAFKSCNNITDEDLRGNLTEALREIHNRDKFASFPPTALMNAFVSDVNKCLRDGLGKAGFNYICMRYERESSIFKALPAKFPEGALSQETKLDFIPRAEPFPKKTDNNTARPDLPRARPR